MTIQDQPAPDGTIALPTPPQPLPAPITRRRGGLAGRSAPVPARLRTLAAARGRLSALATAELDARWGKLALGAIALGTFALVAIAASGPSILVPRSMAIFPAWESGPLHLLFAGPGLSQVPARLGYSGLLIVMTGAYAAALMARRTLSRRALWTFAIATAVILVLSPPLELNDVWNYIGYARLGAIHHLNPYTHVMFAESNDPIYTFSTWHYLSSPYGPLFTALTYPFAFLPIAVNYWVVKIGIVASSLGFLWLVERIARALGRDPRIALLLVAANPIYVFYAIGGFHNDFLMLLPSTAAILLVLNRRDRTAAVVLMLAVAVKLTAIVLLPFLLVAVGSSARRRQLVIASVLAAVPLIAMSLVLFGFSTPNISDQTSVVTAFSVPNLTGLLVGIGGSTQMLLHVFDLGAVLVVLWGLRQRDWVSAAGWATAALIAGVPWLMPWYVIWVLPLAALGLSHRLRQVTVVFTLFLALAFAPETGPLLGKLNIQLMGSRADRAALALQARLQGH